jgi:hypothetical protein
MACCVLGFSVTIVYTNGGGMVEANCGAVMIFVVPYLSKHKLLWNLLEVRTLPHTEKLKEALECLTFKLNSFFMPQVLSPSSGVSLSVMLPHSVISNHALMVVLPHMMIFLRGHLMSGVFPNVRSLCIFDLPFIKLIDATLDTILIQLQRKGFG